jgi:hypothetical protein
VSGPPHCAACPKHQQAANMQPMSHVEVPGPGNLWAAGAIVAGQAGGRGGARATGAQSEGAGGLRAGPPADLGDWLRKRSRCAGAGARLAREQRRMLAITRMHMFRWLEREQRAMLTLGPPRGLQMLRPQGAAAACASLQSAAGLPAAVRTAGHAWHACTGGRG